MEKLKIIAEFFLKHSINLFYVGGAVRDEIMNLPVEDIDICVVGGYNAEQVHSFLETMRMAEYIDNITSVHGPFPIWIVEIDGEKMEFAMARTERKVGQSHQDFFTEVKDVTIEQDLKRRDLTINSIAKNVLTGEIIDPFNGMQHIISRTARPVSEAFKEDALRVYRAARFIARFELKPTLALEVYSGSLRGYYISNERVGIELMKMFKTAEKPSLFFKFLKDIGWLQYHFKELHDCIGVPQSPIHHPEGCAYTHTMHCLDNVPVGDWFMRATMLCHDLGKATETVLKNEHHELNWADIKNSMTLADRIDISAFKITSAGHEEASVPLTRTMLQRIKFTDHKTIRKIACLVKLHMIRRMIEHGNYDKIVRRTLRELMQHGIDYENLVRVTMYDLNGRPPKPLFSYEGLYKDLHVDYAKQLIENGEMTPIVNGLTLAGIGMVEGKEMGEVINKALELQDRGTLKKDNWYNTLKGTFPQLFKKLEKSNENGI